MAGKYVLVVDAVGFEPTKPEGNWVTASRDTPTSPYIHNFGLNHGYDP